LARCGNGFGVVDLLVSRGNRIYKIMYYFGIDPGESGAAVLIKSEKSKIEVDRIFTFYKGQSDLDIAEAIEDMAWRIDSCVIEKLHAYPVRGSIGNFKLGRHYGMLRAFLTAYGVDYKEVLPRVWQKALECLTGGNKNVTKKKAQELFLDVKVTHAIADALLLAEYARRIKNEVS